MDVGPPEVGLIGRPTLPPFSGGRFGAFSAIPLYEAAISRPCVEVHLRPHSSMIKLLDGLSEGVGVGFNQAQAGSWFSRSADGWRSRAFERVTCQIGPAPHELAAEIW